MIRGRYTSPVTILLDEPARRDVFHAKCSNYSQLVKLESLLATGDFLLSWRFTVADLVAL